jgi:acyl carrier protein
MPETLRREEVASTLCRLAAEQVAMDPAGVNLNTDLFADLNYDSLDVVEYVMQIEEAFEVSVPDERTDGVKTIDQAVEMLLTLLPQASPKSG